MTIKELENRSGMERANIRFYEREGLLAPKRLENGYRDYSDEELELLLRIKLLRSLHIPLDEIKGLKEGSLRLDAVLLQQQERLLQEEKDAALAGKVCREIRVDGVSFAQLDAPKYLDQIHHAEDAQPTSYFQKSVKEDTLPQAFYPWRRYLARALDLSLYGLFWAWIETMVFHINLGNRGTWFTLLDTYLGYGLMLLLEPIWLHFFGWTPGKRLLGLRVEGAEGKLSLQEARARTWEMFGTGMGYGIPIFSLVRLWQSYRRCSENEKQPWDSGNQYEMAYYALERVSTLRGIGYIGAHILLLAATGLAVLLQLLPPNRGELTVAEFAENYRYYADYFELDFGNQYFSEDGQWTEKPEDGTYYVDVLEQPTLIYQYTLDGEYLTGASFEMEIDGDQGYFSTNTNEMILSAFAFTGAQKGFLTSRIPWQLSSLISENAFTGYSYQGCGVEIGCTVEQEGYWNVEGLDMVMSEDGALEPYFHQSFWMKKCDK